MKRWVARFSLPILIIGLVFFQPLPSEAASGGRIGGGSFRAPSIPRSRSSYGGGGSYRGGYGGYGGYGAITANGDFYIWGYGAKDVDGNPIVDDSPQAAIGIGFEYDRVGVLFEDQSSINLTYNQDPSDFVILSGSNTGTDTLTAVETLRFDDQDVDITPSGQTLTGTSSADDVTGQSGDDNIDGLGGDDTLDGDDGEDEIQGGDGDDTIKGGRGNDTLYGGAGADTFRINKGSGRALITD